MEKLLKRDNDTAVPMRSIYPWSICTKLVINEWINFFENNLKYSKSVLGFVCTYCVNRSGELSVVNRFDVAKLYNSRCVCVYFLPHLFFMCFLYAFEYIEFAYITYERILTVIKVIRYLIEVDTDI